MNDYQIELGNGYVFEWMLSGEGDRAEINGHILEPKGGILKGSGGWYRTTNPELAAKRAAFAFDLV